MSTAAGLVSGSPLQVALQVPPDTAAPLVAGGDFAAAMAAACVAEPETGVPEGMQSAAALAWLAGFMSTVQPTQPQPQPETGLLADAGVPVDSSDTAAADNRSSSEAVPAAALGFLQEMLQPVVQDAPRDAVVQQESVVQNDSVGESAESPVVVSLAAVERAVALATQPAAAGMGAVSVAGSQQADVPADPGAALASVIPSGSTSAIAVGNAAPVVAPMVAMRTLIADARPDTAVPAQGDPRSNASIALDSAATGDAPGESSMGERLIGALAERVSTRTEGASIPAESDRTAVTGPNPNLYASTRETVASAAGHVSSRPEVVHATVGSPRWANELGSRLAMMSVRGQHEGSLSLTPEHLGPLEVRISVNQDTTNVWFGAQNADTRAALAEAIPRLREMFAASGLALGQAGVSHEMPGREARQSEGSAPRAEAMSETAETPPVRAARISTGLLDAWA